MEIGDLGQTLRESFDAKNSAREQGLAASRSAIRSCGNAIRALHRYEAAAADELLNEAGAFLDHARDALAPHPELLHAGFVHDAEKEYAEALITRALVLGDPFPSVSDVGVSSAAFVKGMAESVGEVRRHILDLMRKGDLKRCEELLDAMDEIYYLLTSMDYPDGITQGLRRLTDVARSIIERTRGDFTTSSIQSSLRAALEKRLPGDP
jgi:translin